MKLLYEGKTKNVFELDNERCLLEFKDDVTGENGRIDPGANTVYGKLEGKGKQALKMSTYYFELLHQQGIPTQYLKTELEKNHMVVKKAEPFGKGLEVVCRFKAYGSFLRRYALYTKEFQPLDALIEITLKDDLRGDPLINDDALIQLGLVNPPELKSIKEMAGKIAKIIKDDLAESGLDLIDIKFEFGKAGGEIILIDDISGDNMRVFKDGHQVSPLELSDMVGKNK
ncbi:MAG TPA: phosphoribosylaminoimidazolesuccinocarboxamide synthase [Syntrophomonadaceae bacterium]|nr:phosphoribosylaminoimidazolesuccinocarboxamide synthase [Syntrophomonadaceae bacterium]